MAKETKVGGGGEVIGGDQKDMENGKEDEGESEERLKKDIRKMNKREKWEQ